MAAKQSIIEARAETKNFAAWFASLENVSVSADVSADDINCEVVIVKSTATSHAARIYIHYVTRYVEIEFVNKYTNAPTKMTRQHVRNTVECEQYLRRNKVIVETRLKKLEDATEDELMIAAKGEGFDEFENRAGAAFRRGEDGQLSNADRTAIILQLREMGFKSIDVTNRDWIVPSTKDVNSKVVTEAQWLNGMQKPRTRKYL